MTKLYIISAIFFIIFIIQTNAQEDCTDAIISSISSTDSNFEVVQSTATNGPSPSCAASSDLVVFDTSTATPVINLGVSGEGCPTSCQGRTFGCSVYQTVVPTSTGEYTCDMVIQGTPGTKASCSWTNGASGADLSEIYFRFYGTNVSEVHIGYTSGAREYTQIIKLGALATNSQYNKFKIVYWPGMIKWYVNTVLLTTAVNSAGSVPMPTVKGTFSVQYVTGKNDKADIALLGEYDGTPSMISVRNISYIPTKCVNGSYFSSDAESSQQETSSSDSDLPWERKCTMKPPMVIYGDSLADGWTDDTKSHHSLDATSPYPKNGTSCISWDVYNNKNFVLTSKSAINVSQWWAIELWVNPGSKGQSIQLIVELFLEGEQVGILYNLSPKLGAGQNWMKPYNWMRVQIPLSEFDKGAAFEFFDQIIISPSIITTDDFQGTVAFDDLKLTNGLHCSGSSDIIYDDKTADGWKEWHDPVDLDEKWTDNTYGGSTYSVDLKLIDNRSAYWHTDSGFSTSDYFAFEMMLYIDPSKQLPDGQLPGLKINVAQRDTSSGKSNIISGMELSSYYGGLVPVGQWTKITIPFADFGLGMNVRLDGVQIIALSSDYQGEAYLDNVKLVALKPDPEDENAAVSSRLISITSLVAFTVVLLLS